MADFKKSRRGCIHISKVAAYRFKGILPELDINKYKLRRLWSPGGDVVSQ